jgi:hypothetical protein
MKWSSRPSVTGIDSPNVARIENELPITVMVQNEQGHSEEKQVLLPEGIG